MNLVIVESPAKAKTIEKYLGKDFRVLASFGHVRDLPEKELGVDVDKDFDPKYVIPNKAKKAISELKKYSGDANIIYLATDLDREGEAISWHLLYALKIKETDPKVKRIVFNEITESAIKNAVAKPRSIDRNLVDAQQARRVLDRLVGYKLSPLLWKKVKTGLSAGRVQSVAVRLVVEREREIKNFNPEEYWVIAVDLSKLDKEQPFRAFLVERDGKDVKKMDVKDQKIAAEIKENLQGAKYSVLSVNKKESLRRPPAPFITSTLQMEASRKLGFSAKQTMMLAQKLYEAGHITYMRTDSFNLSTDAVAEIRKTIKESYGDAYLPSQAQKYTTKAKHAQEAHEAIRPTHFTQIKVSAEAREQRLYDLIWKRTVATQMKEAVVEVIEARIVADGKERFVFVAKGERFTFDGFVRLYTEGRDDDVASDENKTLPGLDKGEMLRFIDLISQQKFTEPPKRYSEAMLVKKLEGLGIGRPSTYAPTLSTIQDRGYVELEEKRFKPTEIAGIVNDLLVAHFENIVDYRFTAKMEEEFDEIAEGERQWVPVIREFYEPFAKRLTEKNKEIDKKDIIKEEATDEKCPECGNHNLVIRLGRYGKFLACPGYPKCKYSRPIESKTDEKNDLVISGGETQRLADAENEKCDKCGGKMTLKEGRFGKFLACENYPTCKNTKTIAKTSGMKCPDCEEGEVIERRTKRGKMFWGCSRYPECKYASWTNPNAKAKDES
ncbi:MAG: type I DNA topoisomerase [Patescibacteria group bacterium]|jgi:DNA topoisomerase-1